MTSRYRNGCVRGAQSAARIVVIGAAVLLTACAGHPYLDPPDFAPDREVVYVEAESFATDGAVYDQGRAVGLFEDFRARRVGDVVTVVLSEATNAAKSSDTSMDKSSTTDIANPTLLGRVFSAGGSNLGMRMDSTHAFSGESDSNQSNRLQGQITVSVVEVLPGGNLVVQGEKWLQLNQGNEYIRLKGVIRPVDIAADNTILSTRVADARISYAGTGAVAEANKIGWLSRFFMSPLWPF